MPGDLIHERRKCFSFFLRCGNVKKHKFISPLGCVRCTQLNRVTGIAKVDKVDAFDCSAVLDIKARDDSLGKHNWVVRDASAPAG